MGNCCGKKSKFEGPGHRLGSAGEEGLPLSTLSTRNPKEENDHEPRVDSKLTNDERETQRAQRLAAAEKRLKASQGKTSNKKKSTDTKPLRGPNSQNTMRWTAG